MKTSTVRAALALVVVGVFMLITAVMALFPLLTKAQVDLTGYADFFVKTASVYTGIIGVIVGYYFARRQDGTGTESPAHVARPGSDPAPKV